MSKFLSLFLDRLSGAVCRPVGRVDPFRVEGLHAAAKLTSKANSATWPTPYEAGSQDRCTATLRRRAAELTSPDLAGRWRSSSNSGQTGVYPTRPESIRRPTFPVTDFSATPAGRKEHRHWASG